MASIVAYAGNHGAGDVTVTLPGTAQAGDYYAIIAVGSLASGSILNIGFAGGSGTGWVTHADQSSTAGGLFSATRRWQSGDATSQTLTVSTGVEKWLFVGAWLVRPAGGETLVAREHVQGGGTSGTTDTLSGLSGVQNDGIAVLVAHMNDDKQTAYSAWNLSNTGSFALTEREERQPGSGSPSNWSSFGSADGVLTGMSARAFQVDVDHDDSGASYQMAVLLIGPDDLDQESFRFRDGSDSVGLNADSAWGAALDTDLTGVDVNSDQFMRLRFVIHNDAESQILASVLDQDYSLEYRVNGGGWLLIGAGSGVDVALSSQYALNDATTQVIATGVNFNTGRGVENVARTGQGATIASGYRTEYEWALVLLSAGLADGDTIDFRLTAAWADGDWPISTVTQTPSITVTKGTPTVYPPFPRRRPTTVARM